MILMVTSVKEGTSYNIPLKQGNELVLITRGLLTTVNKEDLNANWQQLLELNSTPEFPIYHRWADSSEHAINLMQSGEFPPRVEGEDPLIDLPSPDAPQSELPEAGDSLELIVDDGSDAGVQTDGGAPIVEEEPYVEPELEVESETTPEVLTTAEETTPVAEETEYTREYLESLDMAGLREVGAKFGVKNRSFEGLLEEILVAQAKA